MCDERMRSGGFVGELYVVGGHQVPRASKQPEWKRYDQAVIIRANPRSSTATTCVTYVSRPEVRPPNDEGSILFKAASQIPGFLLACTSTEVLLYSTPDFEPISYLSHSAFNDLHHAMINDAGRLVVVNTGLDMVMELDWDGKCIAEHNVNGELPWSRFDPLVDYRRVRSTKPHKSHPNFVFFLDDQMWVTRAEQGDAVCVSDRTADPISISTEVTHDGVVFEGEIYFTTVNGHVVVCDAGSRTVSRRFDLNEFSDRRGGPLGWCRGILPISRDVVVVGFSRLRWTRFKEKLGWARKQIVQTATEPTRRPAHIAAYDLAAGIELWDLDVEQFGLDAVFSIHPS